MINSNFNKLRNYIIENIENRVSEHKGKCCSENLFIVENSLYNDRYILIKDRVFDNIKFEAITLENLKFINCSFKNCIFYNIEFENAIFLDCDLKNSVFKNYKSSNITLKKCKLKNTIFIECSLNKFILADCDCRAFKFVKSEVFNFDFDDNLITKFDEDTFFDSIFRLTNMYEKEKNLFYDKSYRYYKNIAYKFQMNNLLDVYGEYYYLSKVMERKNLKSIDKLKSTILWLICGYGERPTYALFTCLETIFIFTILYMIFGLSYSGKIISYREILISSKPINFIIRDFITAFHFSIVTFTTVGYGDITPIGYSIFLSGIEMFLGVTLVGLWTATLARKISR